MLNHEARGWFSVFFEISVTLGLSAVIWEYNKSIASFLALSVFSMIYPVHSPMSMMAARAVMFGCLWYYLLIRYATIKSLYDIMCIVLMFHVFLAAIQFFQIKSMLTAPLVVGLMANPLELAALIVFCLPACFREKWCLLVPVAGFGVWTAGQFLGVALFCLAGMMYLASKKIYFPLVLGAITSVSYLLVDKPNIDDRVFVLEKTIKAWFEYPFFGFGIGHWKAAFSKPLVDGKVWHTAHNEYSQTLSEVGVLFVPIFLGYLWGIRKKLAVLSGIAMVMILVESGAEFVWHIAPTAMIALMWMAIIEKEALGEKIRV